MVKVLILTHENDPHANAVYSSLERRGVPFFRVDTEKLTTDYEITFHSKSGLYIISGKNEEVTIDEEWNIWNRRVMDPEIPKDVPKNLEEIVFTETKRTWQGLLFAHRGKVVNRPQAEFAANNKIDQLLFARGHPKSVQIPDTLLTNNPGALRRFYREHDQICHKLQRAALVKEGEEYLITYNNLVTSRNMQHADLIRRNPSLFQVYIPKEYELRITALKGKNIAIAIFSQDSEQSKVDFRRYDFDNVRYELINLPPQVDHFCTSLLAHYGLNFGEIDMIRTPQGEYVFLELNPNGQWLWLELKSGYHLTEDVTENLL